MTTDTPAQQDVVDVLSSDHLEKTKKVAPTRPHPAAPNSQLFHRTVGPGAGMVDRLRDRLFGRPLGD